MSENRILKNYKLLKVITSIFGFKFKYILLILFNIILYILNSVFFIFDAIFFPSIQKQVPNNPIFIIGHLRSGTTFLHRFLYENCKNTRAMLLWEMLFPAYTLRIIIKPFLPLFKKISLDKVYNPDIHKTGLLSEETDDIAIYFRYLDGSIQKVVD